MLHLMLTRGQPMQELLRNQIVDLDFQLNPKALVSRSLHSQLPGDDEGELGSVAELIVLAEATWTAALERADPERPTLDDVRETFELLLAAWVFAYSPVTQRRWEALA